MILFLLIMMVIENNDDENDATEFNQRLHDRAGPYTSFHNVSQHQPGPRDTKSAICWLRNVNSFLRDASIKWMKLDCVVPVFKTEPITHSALGKSRPGPKNSANIRLCRNSYPLTLTQPTARNTNHCTPRQLVNNTR